MTFKIDHHKHSQVQLRQLTTKKKKKGKAEKVIKAINLKLRGVAVAVQISFLGLVSQGDKSQHMLHLSKRKL